MLEILFEVSNKVEAGLYHLFKMTDSIVHFE